MDNSIALATHLSLSGGRDRGLSRVEMRLTLLKGTFEVDPIELIVTTEVRNAVGMSLIDLEARVAREVRDRITAALDAAEARSPSPTP